MHRSTITIIFLFFVCIICIYVDIANSAYIRRNNHGNKLIIHNNNNNNKYNNLHNKKSLSFIAVSSTRNANNNNDNNNNNNRKASSPLITNDPKNIISSKYMYPITKSDIKLTNMIANIASQDRNTRFDATAVDGNNDKNKKKDHDCISCREARQYILYIIAQIEDIKYCISLQPKPTTSKPDSIPTNPNCNFRKTRLKFELTKKYIYDHLLKGGTYVDVPKFKNNINLAVSIFKNAFEKTCLQIYDTDDMFKFKEESCKRKLNTVSQLLNELTSITLGQHFTSTDVKIIIENSVRTTKELFQDLEQHNIFNVIEMLNKIDFDILAFNQVYKYIDSNRKIDPKKFKRLIDKTDGIYQQLRENILNHPFPTKQVINVIMDLEIDTKIKPYNKPELDELKHYVLTSLRTILKSYSDTMNNPELMKETNFTSLIFLKHDPKDAAMLLEDKRYHIEEYKILLNITCMPNIVKELIQTMKVLFGKNEPLDYVQSFFKVANLVKFDLVNIIKNTVEQYVIDLQEGEELDQYMNETSRYIKRNLPKPKELVGGTFENQKLNPLTENVKQLHHDLILNLKTLMHQSKKCLIGTIDDCGNEHDDANHNRMSKFECVKNYCQQRVECKILEDCFTKSISDLPSPLERFDNNKPFTICYKNYCKIRNIGISCASQANCADSDLTCENAKCKLKVTAIGCAIHNGSPFLQKKNDNYCLKSAVCENDKCVGNLGATCISDRECKEDLFCYTDTTSKPLRSICTKRKKYGDICTKDDCGPSPLWRCGAEGTCTNNTGTAGSDCNDEGDCADELTCEDSTCRLKVGGIGCFLHKGRLDVDNINDKNCLKTLVCEDDMCVGDLNAACEYKKSLKNKKESKQCKLGLQCGEKTNMCQRQLCNAFEDCPKDFLCTKIKQSNLHFIIKKGENKKIKACTRTIDMKCTLKNDCTKKITTCNGGRCVGLNGMTCKNDKQCLPPHLICFSNQCQLDPINRTNYHKCDAFAKKMCIHDCMEKAGLYEDDAQINRGKASPLLYNTNPEYGDETYNETRSNYCGLCCLDCFCDNSEDHWKSFGKTLYGNFLHLDKIIDDDDEITTTPPPFKEEVNELFEDYNNTAPLKFEKIADSALKGEEKKKQMLNKQKEEDELFGR